MKIANLRDLTLGGLVGAFALFGLWLSRDMPIGTAAEMQAGFFPRAVFWLLLGLAALSALRSFRAGAALEVATHPDWPRALAAVTAAFVLFALAIEPLGLAIAALLLCLVGGLAGPRPRRLEILLLAAGLAAGAVVIFIFALGLPIRIGPR